MILRNLTKLIALMIITYTFPAKSEPVPPLPFMDCMSAASGFPHFMVLIYEPKREEKNREVYPIQITYILNSSSQPQTGQGTAGGTISEFSGGSISWKPGPGQLDIKKAPGAAITYRGKLSWGTVQNHFMGCKTYKTGYSKLFPDKN